MIRIAVTGPESTGKSMLCAALAKELNGVVIPEYARDYLEELPQPYTREDVLTIARTQHSMVNEAFLGKNPVVISDTELLVISIWLNHRYGDSDPWVEEQLKQQKFDIYLLCNIDLPWQEDPLREHPHLRNHFFNLYRQRLEELGFNYHVVSGEDKARLENALFAIKTLTSGF